MESGIKSIVVFCGSSTGKELIYRELAYQLGQYIARMGARLIYGGAKVGLMGCVADGVLNEGGRVIGVIPGFLRTKEVAHEGLTEMIEVETMHERKLKMHALSDAVIALPGGWGTMEELMEMLTWAQLGLHTKPIGMLNVDGFYAGLHQLVIKMQDSGFLKPEHANMLLMDDTIDDLMEKMIAYKAPEVPKWITSSQT